MTRRDLIHKWLVYALGLLPLWLLDDYILPRYPLFGVTPMLLPVAAAAVAVLEGAYAGAGFGMAAGMAIGALAQYALSQSFPGCLLCSAAILALLDLLRVLRGLITHAASLPALLQVAVPEFLYSLAWTPVVYLLFRAIFRRVGGTKLA